MFLRGENDRLILPMKKFSAESARAWGRERTQAMLDRLGDMGADAVVISASDGGFIIGREVVDVEQLSDAPEGKTREVRTIRRGGKSNGKVRKGIGGAPVDRGPEAGLGAQEAGGVIRPQGHLRQEDAGGAGEAVQGGEVQGQVAEQQAQREPAGPVEGHG